MGHFENDEDRSEWRPNDRAEAGAHSDHGEQRLVVGVSGAAKSDEAAEARAGGGAEEKKRRENAAAPAPAIAGDSGNPFRQEERDDEEPRNLSVEHRGQVVVTETENAEVTGPEKDGDAEHPNRQAAEERMHPARQTVPVFRDLAQTQSRFLETDSDE